MWSLISFVTTSFLTYCLTPIFIFIAYALKFLDLPDNHLKNHKQPTPYLGGLAIYAGFLFGFLYFFPVDFSFLGAFYLITFCFLILGLIDDRYRLTPLQKWLGQLCIVILCFFQSISVLTYSAAFLYCVWTLSVVNMYNLVDVMDGLASLLAFFAAISFALVYYNNILIKALCVPLSGAIFGFFYFNRPPAKIYLGDAGSMFLGAFFAQIPLFLVQRDHAVLGIDYPISWLKFISYCSVPAFIMLIPALEVATLIVVRWYKNIPFYAGSHDHFAHHFLRKGWSKNTILIVVASASLALFVPSFLAMQSLISFPFFILQGVVFVALWYSVLFFA